MHGCGVDHEESRRYSMVLAVIIIIVIVVVVVIILIITCFQYQHQHQHQPFIQVFFGRSSNGSSPTSHFCGSDQTACWKDNRFVGINVRIAKAIS